MCKPSMLALFFPIVLAGGAMLSQSGNAAEIGYAESFALAADRDAAIRLLIPGSPEYYYYSCLHLQNTQQFDRVAALLKQWIGRHGRTPQVLEIQLRQALLTYEKDPRAALETIRQHLRVQFQHQRQTLGESPDVPSEFDQLLIERDRLIRLALGEHANLDGFENAALDWLVAHPLDGDRRRQLLERLQRPDYPQVPRLVVEDLNYKQSRGFGSLEIHSRLLLAQLDECLRLKPDLLNQQQFVAAYLVRLQPDADADLSDLDTRAAHLDRLWGFVRRLSAVHNSLKTHVLYQRLALDRQRGMYDKGRFLEYIQLPRNAVYIARTLVELESQRQYRADLSANFEPLTRFPPVGVDELLVRDYLQHFFIEETSTKPYEPYIQDVYLRHVLAETKILYGLGEPEQWYSLLPPEMYEQLKERVELEFAPSNRTRFRADEPVVLDLDIKNVRNLLVKVFEIHAGNYYREHLAELNTDVNLDGLIASDERVLEYDEPPLRRVRRHFEFPSLNRPGVYVIDFIGNGMSSRVLIRKGKLRPLVRTSTAGHVFTILDEQNAVVSDARLFVAGREYVASANGKIVVPFTDQPGSRPVVVTRGSLSTLDAFHHDSEQYALKAGIYVDRESLLSRRRATAVIRPALYLNGTPVTLQVLSNVRLQIATVDQDGVQMTKDVSPLPVAEDRETTYEFQVPPRLASIRFTLRAKVRNLSQNKDVELAAEQGFDVNGIDATGKVEDLHLARFAGEYVLELLGKSGEAKGDRAVQVSVKHRDFRKPISVTLKTDPRGRIALGALEGIATVEATGPEQTVRNWTLPVDQHSHPQSLHGVAGQPLEIPLASRVATGGERPAREEVSLLELRGGVFLADRFEHLFLEDGALVARGLPAGDYSLWLKRADQHLTLRLAAGERREGYVLGKHRYLESPSHEAVQIASVVADDEFLRVRLRHASKFARVHVFATRYLPAHHPYARFAEVGPAEPLRVVPARSDARYVSGRNIGDEYRYILDRRFASKHPGLMLDRPGLLLNPWAVRSTETGVQDARAGTAFDPSAAPAPGLMIREPTEAMAAAPPAPDATPSLDFLAESTVVLANLAVEGGEELSIPLDRLSAHQHVHVVAVDPTGTAYRSLSLPERPLKTLDLRLAKALSSDRHFTQQKQITPLAAGGNLEVADMGTAKWEVYDSLPRVYALYQTISRNETLAEFEFCGRWPQLSIEDKRAKYSQYACHELNFFLYKKDPDFFRAVIRPYLSNKKDKTFLDRWLIGEELGSYLRPWRYEQLNIVERILLARRIESDREAGRRHVAELLELRPVDLERRHTLFLTALRGNALSDTTGSGRPIADMERLSELQRNGIPAADAPLPGARLASPQAGGIRFGRPGSGAASEGEQIRRQALSPQRGRAEEKKELAENAAVDEAGLQARQKLGRESLGFKMREAGKSDAFYESDKDARGLVRQLYERLDRTQEWAENNYYHLPNPQQGADLVQVSAFWNDYAAHDGEQPFLSRHFADATHSFAEMMFALALLDLPFDGGKSPSHTDDHRLTLTATAPLIVVHEEIREAAPTAEKTPILVSQNYFQVDDRFRYEGGEQLDKFITDEFLVSTVYGCQVAVTNPTSSAQKLDVLVQVPEGALPVKGSEYTQSIPTQLEPFGTKTIEYFFYFPAAGKYPHYPVHVARNEQLIAHAEATNLVVVEQLSRVDRDSWAYVSQFGTEEDVLEFLTRANLQRLDLEKIAFRMRDKPFFLNVVERLTSRHAYNHVLWSYGILHDVPDAIAQYLQHEQAFVDHCGEFLESPLLTIDPVARKNYEQLEYAPLVNARVHQLGRKRQILNDRLAEQYHALLEILRYKRQLDNEDRMAITYYLLLQDRIDEALAFFESVDSQRLQTRVQYDYLAVCFALYEEDIPAAETLAKRYADYPVDRWRKKFALVSEQIEEIRGGTADVVDPKDRDQAQTHLSATEPALEFQIEGQKIQLTYQNLTQVTVQYYLMDVELLFSRNPFVQSQQGSFAFIRPNRSQTIELTPGATSTVLELPADLQHSNVLVEVSGGGQRRSQSYYANSLAVQLTESYGQLRVVTANPGKPLAKVYVKVYARLRDGSVKFYKDGYTDLRGRFDYASLSTNELDQVDRFALLILSEDHGAVVREANPPRP